MIHSWLRRTLPGVEYFYGGLFVQLAILVIAAYINSANGFSFDPPVSSGFGLISTYFFTCLYGFSRPYFLHPAFNADYHNWLDQTPWKHPLPLPLGPVHLVLQDVLIVGIQMCFVSQYEYGSMLLVLTLFLTSYLIALIACLDVTKARFHAYVLLYGLGAIVWLWGSPAWMILLMLSLLYVVARHGLNRSLRRLPEWNTSELQKNIDRFSNSFKLTSDVNFNQQLDASLGWPFEYLQPTAHRPNSALFPADVTFLCGWYLLIVVSRWAEGVALYFSGIIPIVMILLALYRTYLYYKGVSPPISLAGRLLTGQWIIPGFDLPWITSLLMITVEIGATSALYWYPEFITVLVPGRVVIGLLLLEYLPPDRAHWRFTGNYRINPRAEAASKSFIQTQ